MADTPKILVAEDEEINYLYIFEALSEQNYNIIHAWNGQDAVEIYKKEKPDVILMDIKMPKLNGFEALAEIKQIDPAIPIIALTAHALSGDKEKALEAGFDFYLSKPVSEDQLLDAIKRYL